MSEADLRRRRATTATLRLLAAYYVVGGLWPVVWYRSFSFITGDKRDVWLVKTFGLVLAAFGAAVARDLRHGQQPVRTSVAVAGAVAAADTWYVLRRRIRWVYLFDAMAEVALLRRLLRG